MTIVDYMGHRVFATATLEHNEHTALVYGSKSLGAFVNSDDQMAKLMEAVSQELNLQGHYHRNSLDQDQDKEEQGVWMDGLTDLQGHLCVDGRRYAINLSGVMPPEDHLLLK